MPAEGNKGVVCRFYAELDRRHGAAVDHLVSPAFVAFPDLEHVVEDLVAEGERVVARLTERGTHRGVFQGVAPTGKVVSMAAIGVHRLVDGRLAELWLVADALGRLRQLGALPDAGGG